MYLYLCSLRQSIRTSVLTVSCLWIVTSPWNLRKKLLSDRCGYAVGAQRSRVGMHSNPSVDFGVLSFLFVSVYYHRSLTLYPAVNDGYCSTPNRLGKIIVLTSFSFVKISKATLPQQFFPSWRFFRVGFCVEHALALIYMFSKFFSDFRFYRYILISMKRQSFWFT